MFNRYWRTYPWYIQLFQFIILMMVFFSFLGMGMTPLILKWFNVSAESFQSLNEKSPRNSINAGLIIQLFTASGLFLLPPLLFAYFTHPRPLDYLGLRLPKKFIHLLLCVIIIVSATPLLLSIAEWVSSFDIEAAKKAQEANDRLTKAFLSMHSFGEFLFSFFIIAILAGVSEELFFRGLLMRFSAKRISNVWAPVIITALLFASMHSNIFGLPSIFIAGVLLGTFYYLTSSLWCSILSHVVYNGMQIILVYFADNNETLNAINNQNSVPVLWVVIGTIISLVAFYTLWKTKEPLSLGWAADYTPEEIEQGIDKDELS